MGIQICSNKGSGPFWGSIRGKIRKMLIILKKDFFSWTTGRNVLIFGMGHSWGKEIQDCSNTLPGVTTGHALRGHIFVYTYIAKIFKNLLHMNYLANFNQSWWETCLGMEIQICSNKGSGPFGGPIRGKIRKMLINLKKFFFSWTTGRNALIFCIEHPWGKELLFKWKPWGHKWPRP